MVLLLRRCLSGQAGRIITSKQALNYPATSSHHYLLMECEHHKEKSLIVDPMTKEETTGERLLSQVGRMANKLKSQGMGSGDHVAIVGLNHLNYLPAKLGVMATGAVPVLFNPLYNKTEMLKLLQLSECNFAIGHACSRSNIEAVLPEHNLKILPNVETFDEWAKDEPVTCPEFNGSVHDTAMMMFSSGTTGLPKSVELTHDNLNSQLAALKVSSSIGKKAGEWGIDQVTMVDFLPEFHAYGSLSAKFCVMNGYKRVALPFFTPELFLDSLQDYKANGTTVVPPVMLMLAKLDIVPNYDLSALKMILVGAAPLAPETETAVMDRLKECNPGMELHITQGYGCTETSGAATVADIDVPSKPGTVGQVIPGQEIKLVDVESGEMCGPHERGEIWIRGPQIMKGYYKNPAANAECMEGEWLRTGDIAYYDDNEDFFIVDRLKEFIKVKGFQVAPAELEAVLLTHDEITDCAVIGIPHERSGEAPKAYVVKSFKSTMSEEGVKEYVASQVSDYKQLAEVEFVKTIPKLPSGKIQRRILRDQHAQKAASL